ncbi:predicted protein [Scheffersomyces stipitis CBS 6054]|uniref:Uncharacterized protein n=1 Tax=Scheffersomyces stipitis (strain ATCC 58785 / CBS 6054 / NBRC 10063 / NRRL Y-11545) TaxID=322104 RepID=A3LNW1_PICST|nr:predicted protein [Scheffersomyces stipitis CBS 6054]ABN64935.1 predicted protein [Scheffersomyces stipitis CBS 6054]
MDKPFDEIQAISTLLHGLTSGLADSAERINNIQTLTEKLVDKEKYEEFIKDTQVDFPDDLNGKPIEEQEELLIRQLEKDRLDMVLELQRHDFIGEKLLELIDQNEDIVETVKEYLQSKDSIRREEEEYAKKRFENYAENILQPTIDQLDTNLFDLYTGMHKVQEHLKEFTEISEETNNTMVSPQYQSDLNMLVSRLNEMVHKFEESAIAK